MKFKLVLLAAVFVVANLPASSEAQPRDGSYWAVSFYTVDWTKTDSLRSLLKLNEPTIALRKERGEILESITLVHQYGNDKNVVFMTKYPSWSAINAPSDAFRTIWSDDAERQKMRDGFNYVYGAGVHEDGIYWEGAGSIMPSSDDSDGAYWYANYYEIDWRKVSDLTGLWESREAVPAEAVNNGSILGIIRLVHHTGSQAANVISMRKFPSWDALENQSWGGARRTVEPDSLKRAANRAISNKVFENLVHYDVLYGQWD